MSLHLHRLSCDCHSPNRRGLLTGLVGVASWLALGDSVSAQTQAQVSESSADEKRAVPALREPLAADIAKVKRIDVHHHPVPPAYIEAVTGRNGLAGPLRGWSPEKSLADMDRASVSTAMLSIPANGLWLPNVEANRRLARACNEFMAGLVKRYPGRFGFWAALPLPDIEGSLKELEYAMDTLGADGVGLFTVYGKQWLGNPAFTPLFEELDRRGCVVFTHPTSATCCSNLVPGVPDSIVEYGTDTARAIASLVFSGSAARFPNVKLIFSHAGGTMPALIERFVFLGRQPDMDKVAPRGVLPLLGSFFYDVAQSANPEALGALMRIVPPRQILFGTDYPYRTSIEYVAALAGCDLTDTQLAMIGRENALPLLRTRQPT